MQAFNITIGELRKKRIVSWERNVGLEFIPDTVMVYVTENGLVIGPGFYSKDQMIVGRLNV